MNDNKFKLTEELLQRYYDGELDESGNRLVEQALAEDSQAAALLEDFRAVGNLLRAAADSTAPDQLTARRTWEAIDSELRRPGGKSGLRRNAAWLGAVAAAAAIVLYLSPLNFVPTVQASNELEIEDIDCNYASFMLLQPEAENGHTIIWINDPGDGE
ncbi:MAG: hypothetical protein FVQ81_11760 [Candidatus Glassbacteria bacterium]|nr:hypothetical protein [Candidatus Glassbacteria bacterium]